MLAQRLRFVGMAVDRVQEDALRMLRFCRFSIEYSNGHYDSEAVLALTSFATLATRLSGERVSHEIRNILSHERCAPAINLLHQTGLDKASLGCDLVVGSAPVESARFAIGNAGSGWLVLLVAIIPQTDVTMVLQRLRLSRAEQKFCEQLAQSNPAQVFAQLSALNWRQSAFFMKRRAAAFYACAAWRLGKALDRQHYRVLYPVATAKIASFWCRLIVARR